jgi:hypothetical protein
MVVHIDRKNNLCKFGRKFVAAVVIKSKFGVCHFQTDM